MRKLFLFAGLIALAACNNPTPQQTASASANPVQQAAFRPATPSPPPAAAVTPVSLPKPAEAMPKTIVYNLDVTDLVAGRTPQVTIEVSWTAPSSANVRPTTAFLYNDGTAVVVTGPWLSAWGGGTQSGVRQWTKTSNGYELTRAGSPPINIVVDGDSTWKLGDSPVTGKAKITTATAAR